MQKRLTWMLLILMALVVFAGCSSDDDDPAAPQKTTFEVVAEAGSAYINNTGTFDYTIGKSLITADALAATFPKDGKASDTYTVVDIRDKDTYDDLAFAQLSLSESHELAEIRDAVARIDNGTFGVCEECGEHILKTRLEVLPYTTMCVQCQGLSELRMEPTSRPHFRLSPA